MMTCENKNQRVVLVTGVNRPTRCRFLFDPLAHASIETRAPSVCVRVADVIYGALRILNRPRLIRDISTIFTMEGNCIGNFGPKASW